MPGQHTLDETESQVATRLAGMDLDFEAMAVTANLFRAANAARNQMERTVLAKSNLTWTGFVVLWVAWIWETAETREIASEAGVSKATLSGVLTTLESRGLLERKRGELDGRLVTVELTAAGKRLMKGLFPEFNKAERHVTRGLDSDQLPAIAEYLRQITQAARD
jgi:DNA-binding MarR family transcriptional regulator